VVTFANRQPDVPPELASLAVARRRAVDETGRVVRPETKYALSGDVYVAYQVFGEGSFDLVVAPGLLSNIEYGWELESWVAFYRGLAAFARVILFDKRGSGVSDPVSGAPLLEERMDDIRAVLDAAGSERAALHGAADGAALALLFAATYPDRAAALVLHGPRVRGSWAPDYPWGDRDAPTPPGSAWTSPEMVESVIPTLAPSRVGDDEYARWSASYLRLSASPTTAASLFRMFFDIDVRHVLPAISVPTLVTRLEMDAVSTTTDRELAPSEESRYVCERIPGARYVERKTGAPNIWGDDASEHIAIVREFLTEVWEDGAWEPPEPDRVLATVLFTDIVGSTELLAALGDAGWRDLAREHHAVVRRQLSRFRGREVDTAGDGFFATFDGPARGIRCASAISDAVGELGIEVRTGLHTGECEVIDGGKVGGIAVHIGARVAAAAAPGEVLVSSTVKDLVSGSGVEFEDRGTHELKGIPGDWRLFAVIA
jgi:class 3 adenylate cyclase